MIKSAQNKPVSELLSVDAAWKFKVPRYQREYVWRRYNWEHLLDDLMENPPGYFLGSMICINRSDDTMQVQELEVVDGQQRMTTLSLLYAAVYACLAQCCGDNEDAKHELFNLKHRLIFKGKKISLRMEPSYQGHNYHDYMAILQECGILANIDKPANAGNRLLFKAYRFFIDRLDELDDKGKKVFDAVHIQGLLDRLNQASMVKIEVGSHADAFTLFESLNNRGVPLSALDLIKNNLLATLEKKEPDSIDDNFTKWTKLLENLSDDYSAQERFLRQYYNAFKHRKEITVAKAPLATRSNIIRIYDDLIKKDPGWLFDDLSKKAKLYNRLISPLSDGVPPKLAKQLLDLDRIGGAPVYILLLYLMADRSKADLVAITDFLVRYSVRRNITDLPPTRDVPRIFMDVIAKMESATEGGELALLKVELLKAGRVATDAQFLSALTGDIYEDNVDATRFVLCKIEEDNQTKEKMTDLWQRDDKNDFIWTVEHIFPQGPNIPDVWVKMIADGDETKAKAIREKYVHKIGNLTVTGYNSKLGNKSFLEKRDRTDTRGKQVGYNNGLYLNETLKKRKSWTVDDIEERTRTLVGEAVKLFSLR